MSLKKIAIPLIVSIGVATMAFTNVQRSTTNNTEKFVNENENYLPIVVLELFTSQGCSSCPPADMLLNSVKQKNENTVFALSYHVDYWNFIGWQDPFSNAENTERQRMYNSKFKSKSNYTPELVVNGKEHFVGSNASLVAGAIQRFESLTPENEIVLSSVNGNSDSITFAYKIKGNFTDKNLRAVLVLDQRTTKVSRGENRNRSLINSNIVVTVKDIAVKENDGKSCMKIPDIVKTNEKISLLLLAENQNLDITGAAKSAVIR